MRDHRFDGPPVTTDITDKVWAHTGENVVRPASTRIQRDKRKAKIAKASRRRNR